MPYRVPAWAFKIIGIKTMILPSVIVSTASHQFIPSAIRDDASMYVGMQAHMLIQRAAMSPVPHFRAAREVGAMSAL